MIDYLSYEDVLQIAAGVIGEVVVTDQGLLACAVMRPQITVMTRDAYPSMSEKAAALMHGIARNHPVIDGNKRLAWSTARVFLLMNGYHLYYETDDAEPMVVGVAKGDLDVPEIAQWLSARMKVSTD